MQRFSRLQDDQAGPRGVRALLERPPAVREDVWVRAALDLFRADATLEWVPIVGYDNRPVALAGRPHGLAPEPRLAAVDRIEPDLDFAGAARLAMERAPAERLVPFVHCDGRGRYVAVVRIEVLVARLADASALQALRSATS
jgi:hypothetical protein